MYKHNHFVVFLFITLIFILFHSCGKKPEVAAKIDDLVITIPEFKENLKEKYRLDTLTSLTDAQKMQSINHLIEKKLKFLAARDSGFTEDPIILSKIKNGEANQLFKLNKNNIIKNKFISEVKKRKLYNDFEKLAKVKNILIQYKESFQSKSVRKEEDAFKIADSLKTLIGKNGSFAFFAHKHSEGMHAEKGGDLGYINKSAINSELGNAIFTAPLNKVIGPVKTKFGMHLLIVEEFKNNEDLQPYAKMENELESIIINKNKKPIKNVLDAYSENILSDIKFKISENGLLKFTEALNHWASTPPLIIDSLFFKVKDIILLKSGNFIFTGGEFIFSVKQYNKNFNQFNTVDKLSAYLKNKQIFLAWVLDAKNKKLHKSNKIQQFKNNFLENLVIFKLETIWRMQVQIPEDSVKIYYENNKDKFKIGPKKSFDEVRMSIKRELLSHGIKEKNRSMLKKINEKYPIIINEKNVRAVK